MKNRAPFRRSSRHSATMDRVWSNALSDGHTEDVRETADAWSGRTLRSRSGGPRAKQPPVSTRFPKRCAPVTRSTSIAWIFVESITKLSFNPMQAVSTWTEKQAGCGKNALHRARHRSLDGHVNVLHLRALQESGHKTSCQSPVQPMSTLATVLAAQRRG